jgi:hypothetical protein
VEFRSAEDALPVARLKAAGARVERHSPLLPDPAEAATVYMHLLLSNLAANGSSVRCSRTAPRCGWPSCSSGNSADS